MRITVGKIFDGKILRDLIKSIGVSGKTLTRLKNKENGIMLNGVKVTVRAIVKSGDIVELGLEDENEDVNPNVAFCGMMPEIIYEDEAVLVVNKPAGMPTHTSFGHADDSLANAVLAYYHSKGKPFVFRAINRLDKDTSGTVLIAKNRYFASILSDYMAKGKIKKKYLCIVEGIVPESGKIEGYISREGQSIIKRKMTQEHISDSDHSLTYFERISCSGNASSVIASPITGRTHQIRVHFASIGSPLYGDGMYGKESELISRQALHAVSLEFPSPIDGRSITVNAGIPDDIKELAKKLKLKLSGGEE